MRSKSKKHCNIPEEVGALVAVAAGEDAVTVVEANTASGGTGGGGSGQRRAASTAGASTNEKLRLVSGDMMATWKLMHTR